MMETIQLMVGGKACHIIVGNDILGNLGVLVSKFKSAERFAIITNPKVNSLYGNVVSKSLRGSGLDHVFFEVADSEGSKSLEAAQGLYVALSKKRFDRDTCIIGLGGGVVGDLAGFVAATYLRGVDLVQIPTTLLAQVDSAIGGKTGVNLPEGKNLVGAFHQPVLVLSDIVLLKSLPDEDFRSGLAEVVKYGVLGYPKLFARLEKDIEHILRRDNHTLTTIVSMCSAIKARIVEEDETDHGRRLVLNLGHTLGHALEAATDYNEYRHGEAVAIGMVFAAKLSVKLGLLKEKELHRLTSLLTSLGLPTAIERPVETELVIKYMDMDKKTRAGKLRFVLPDRIGEVVVSDAAGPDLVWSTLEELQP